MILLIPVAGVLLYFMFAAKGDSDVNTRLYGLADVDPSEQKGSYKTDYDLIFKAVADEFGVPFALLKAHAIQESSINANAFRDESNGRADRPGWASRGLMQLLWSPLDPKTGDKGINNQRWAKYGYSAKDLGVDGIRQFEPLVNVRIAAQLIRDNLKSCNGNVRDAINMYNAGVKESVNPAPGNYTGKVYGYYTKILGSIV